MILIIGGAYQGKLEYAQNLTNYKKEEFLDGKTCEMDEIFHAKGILGFHEYVKRWLVQGRDPKELAEELRSKNPNLVVVTNELGYGVVPCDALDRQWREATGRVCTKLAKASKMVVRVVCGIGMVLKDETDSND